jgi:hypothetical protein
VNFRDLGKDIDRFDNTAGHGRTAIKKSVCRQVLGLDTGTLGFCPIAQKFALRLGQDSVAMYPEIRWQGHGRQLDLLAQFLELVDLLVGFVGIPDAEVHFSSARFDVIR